MSEINKDNNNDEFQKLKLKHDNLVKQYETSQNNKNTNVIN